MRLSASVAKPTPTRADSAQMSGRRLIGPFERVAHPDLRSTAGHARPIPDDLLRQATRRLAILALIGTGLWFLGPALGHVAALAESPSDPRWAQFRATDVIAISSIAVSLALFFYLRARDPDPTFVTNLALVYLVIMTFSIGLMMHMEPVFFHLRNTGPVISWAGPVILMVAAIVPVPPWKMLIVGFLAASMDPLGMLIARSAGTFQFDSAINAFLMHYPNYLMLGVAVVISQVVTRLGQQVAREREMGSYRLGDLLGRGGMGEVYQATHRMLARPAAIKLIRGDTIGAHDGDAAQLAVKRFRREAEAAASLRSPHTVELYDFGLTDDQTLYFVMELLEGMTLERMVREHGAMPAGRAIYVLRQVCESLEEAHVRGLVHRDIKPANIHVGRVGLQYDFVKVLDFGLVKSVAGSSDGDSLATAAGLTPGTPAYMSPEMSRGDTVNSRADIYAVGCVAYYLLTGQLVFEADNPYQMIARHLGAVPVPPSRRANVSLPAGLDELVLSCLAKEPADRPSAAELARSLTALDAEPWSEEDARKWWEMRGQEALNSGVLTT
jgi:eukaryotic-like serine/threonine-protein kinase